MCRMYDMSIPGVSPGELKPLSVNKYFKFELEARINNRQRLEKMRELMNGITPWAEEKWNRAMAILEE